MKKLSRAEMKNVSGGYYNGEKGGGSNGCFTQGVVCGASSGDPSIPCCGGLECLPNAGHVYSCQPSN